METERDHPRTRERTEILARCTFSQTDVAALVIRIYFDFRRRNCAPLRFSTLGSDEVGQIGKSFHYPNRRVRREIGSKHPK